jgi:hypothetical protein
MNRKKIVSVVEVTKAVLAQAYMGEFFIYSVSDTKFAMIFLPKPSVHRRGPLVIRGPQFDKSCFNQ